MEYIEYLGLPATVVICLAAAYLVMNLVGELLEFKGKVVPEFLKIRKYFARKRQERETLAEVQKTLADAKATLEAVKVQLLEVNTHYSTDNITMRDNWMHDVDDRQSKDHAWIERLDKKLDKIGDDTMAILIENKRSEIIGFASYVIDDKAPATREQFRRIFKTHKDYEKIIKENGLTNGEVDTALRIIQESYEQHMRNHSFVEDVRGYGA